MKKFLALLTMVCLIVTLMSSLASSVFATEQPTWIQPKASRQPTLTPPEGTGQPTSTPAPAPPEGMVNLSEGKTYTVTQGVPAPNSTDQYDSWYYTPGALTDGLIGTMADWNSGLQWQGYCRAQLRSIVIDMGQVNTINQMQGHFLHYPQKGIYFPRKVTFALSQNGIDWAEVGTADTAIPLTHDSKTDQYYTISGLNYQARYVKFTFLVDIFVFLDELQVFGLTGIQNGATVPAITPPVSYPDAYCPPGSATVGGAKDMVLIYNGYYPVNPDIALNTVDELTPYVGYTTTSGTITDFMFDGFLFIPLVAFGAPSGGVYYCDPTRPTIKSDWEFYLDDTFDPIYNLAALDTAVGNVKAVLGNPEYKAKVEIAIPYPTHTAVDFGDVDNDGISENLTYLADKQKVVKWYIDELLARWTAANFSNLDLTGLYWYDEQANLNIVDDEPLLLSYAGNYVRSKGKVFNWIPYYQAMGFAEYDSLLGFDEAILQPNYCFGSYPEGVLEDAAGMAKHFGMGIEIEIHWDALTDPTYRDKYYAYLNHGITEGYMTEAVHMYYQNGGPGTFYDSCNSTDPEVRDIYDQTYNFIKRTYTIH